MLGTHHQVNMDDFRSRGVLGNDDSGTLQVNKDLKVLGGSFSITDSVDSSTILSVGNDDYHANHAGNIQFEAGVVGRGNVTIYPLKCPENVQGTCEESFKVDQDSNVTAGKTLTVLGTVSELPTDESKFKINRLGINGGNVYSLSLIHI